MNALSWSQLAEEADREHEKRIALWTDEERAAYDQALEDAHSARNANMFPSEFIPLFDHADDLALLFDKRHEAHRKRLEAREAISGDAEKVAQWDAEGSCPIIETHYASDYGNLYLPPAGPSADLIFEWIAQTSNAVTGKHTSLAGKRYVSFRKGDFRTRLEIALGIIYPEYRRISTRWDVCNVSCREAYDIECVCRCDHRHHQKTDWSGYRIVPYSHAVLVREHANDEGIFVDDDIIYNRVEAPKTQEKLVQEYISGRGTSDEHQWAYIYFEEAQTDKYRADIIEKINSTVEERKKLVGELRAAR